jgi:SAM-dependent methyltransferase
VGLFKRTMKRAIGFLYNKIIPFYAHYFDQDYLDSHVPISKLTSHSKFMEYLSSAGNHPELRVLEIGSREVTGRSNARNYFSKANYVGFDYYSGPNVDVVGDAHKLSEYFEANSFDIIYSSAVFEHFAMPWVVATEIAKLLKVGGLVFVETHFSYGSHERPWHFFQFSDMALRVLFSRSLGIECIEAGVSNPIVGRFSFLADEYLRFRPIPGLYCHSEFLGQKVEDVPNFSWNQVKVDTLVQGTKYPEPAGRSNALD